jgi:hypothetical protein
MNNTNKLDVTKLDKQAAELGYSYRRGIKPGSGYNLTDDISGDKVLGDDDYTASLKAVKEFLDTVAKQLRAKAKQLGYSYERDDDEDRDGYVLIDDSTGEIALGDGYTATLKDIRAFLDNVAADLGVEVEITKLPKIGPPSQKDISKALRGHELAAEIKAMTKSAKVADPSGPTLDLKFEQRALKSREEFKPNWNDIGGHEYNENDEADGGRELKQYVEDEKRKLEIFEKNFAPDKATPGFDTPKAVTGFVVTSKKCRVKKADISPKARTLLTIETAIRAAQLKGDKAGIGKLLLEAKASTIDHGDFMQWAERATGLTSRSCRNYMTMADQNGK